MMSAASCSRVSLLLLAVAAAACSSDQPKRTNDAGDVAVEPAAGTDAGDSAPVIVGAGEVPTVDTQVDAGHIGDAVVDPMLDGPAAPPTKPSVDPIQVTIFNRLIVKPKTKGLTAGQVQELAEEATGKKIALVRRTAGTFFLLQFEPTKPARMAKEQKALMAALDKTGAFANVEGDQVMTIK